MERPIAEIRDLCSKYDCPLICAGDVFHDGWRERGCPPQLVNWAIRNLPFMYAVPGQHDLPHHRYGDVHNSAYWTLVSAGVVWDIHYTARQDVRAVSLYGFPWGEEVVDIENDLLNGLPLNIAVIHKYIWTKDTGYPGAPDDAKFGTMLPLLDGYDVAVFGDNHKGFLKGKVLNCGSLMRRNRDQCDYKPSVGLIREDGTIDRHYLDCSEDKFVEDDEMVDRMVRSHGEIDFTEELAALGDVAVDFAECVRRMAHKSGVPTSVRDLLLQSLEARGKEK